MLHLSTTTRGHRRGNYTMTMGAMLPIAIGFAALSVDISYINMCRTQAQHVADASAHAALVAFRETRSTGAGEDAAEAVNGINFVGEAHGKLSSVEFGNWDFTAQSFVAGGTPLNAARASVARSDAEGNALSLFFAPLLGVNKASVAGVGVSANITRDLMVVHDVSGSFRGGTYNSPPSSPYKAMGDARDATLAFFDFLVTDGLPGDRFGMTVFGGHSASSASGGEYGAPYNAIPGHAGGNFPIFVPLQPIGTDDGGVVTRINLLNIARAACYNEPAGTGHDCDNGKGRRYPGLGDTLNPRRVSNWTAQHYGLRQAINVLVSQPATNFRGIVLVSDGLPTCGPASTTCGTSGAATSGYNAAVEQADRAEAAGISIWTVTFENGSSDFSVMENLVRGRGRAYMTPDSTQLQSIMIEIARSIPVVITE